MQILITSVRFLSQRPGHSCHSIKSLVIADQGESRLLLEEMFQSVRDKLLAIKKSTLEVIHDGFVYKFFFRFSFSADMKFLYLALGQSNATSTFPCIYCTCPEELRGLGFVLKEDYLRSFGNQSASSCPYCAGYRHAGKPLRKCPDRAHGVKQSMGNLLKDIVELDDIFVDLLHMKLRLSDRIEYHMHQLAEKHNTVSDLEKAVGKLGITYKPYKSKKDNKETLSWPSLPCDMKMEIMRNIKVSDFVPDGCAANKLQNIMLDFVEVMDFLSCHRELGSHSDCSHTIRTSTEFTERVNQMSTIFALLGMFYCAVLNIEAERKWVDIMHTGSITPYFHILECHVLPQIRLSPFKSIAQFQLQGQESIHQCQTAIMFRATNRKGNKSEAIAIHELNVFMYELHPEITFLIRQGLTRLEYNPRPHRTALINSLED